MRDNLFAQHLIIAQLRDELEVQEQRLVRMLAPVTLQLSHEDADTLRTLLAYDMTIPKHLPLDSDITTEKMNRLHVIVRDALEGNN